jgi:hypothetical protein
VAGLGRVMTVCGVSAAAFNKEERKRPGERSPGMAMLRLSLPRIPRAAHVNPWW